MNRSGRSPPHSYRRTSGLSVKEKGLLFFSTIEISTIKKEGSAMRNIFNGLLRRFPMVLLIAVAMTLVTSIIPTGVALAKDKIVIGCAIALSGENAVPAQSTQVTEYKLWVEQKNAEG